MVSKIDLWNIFRQYENECGVTLNTTTRNHIMEILERVETYPETPKKKETEYNAEVEEELLKKAFEDIPQTSVMFVTKLGDITDIVEHILKEKEWTMDILASKMDRKLEDLYKWFYSPYNLTLRNIVEIETALGVEIVTIRDKENYPNWV